MGIRQLRDNLTQTIQRVRRGETIEVTHHGAPVAVLSPVPSDRLDRLIATGEVTPGKPLQRLPRRFQVTGAQTATQALEEDRSGR